MNTFKELSDKEVTKLHHYWGHCSVEKLGCLIQNAGRMTDQVKQSLDKIKKTCESCRVNKNRKLRQVVSIPRALVYSVCDRHVQPLHGRHLHQG